MPGSASCLGNRRVLRARGDPDDGCGSGETRVSADLGQDTSRRAKAGPAIHRAARGGSYTPPKKSGCFGPAVTTTGGSTKPRASLLANRRSEPVSARRPVAKNPSGATGPAGHQRERVHAVNGKQGFQPDGRRVRRVYGAPGCASGESQGRATRRREPCSSLDAQLLQSRTAAANRRDAPARWVASMRRITAIWRRQLASTARIRSAVAASSSSDAERARRKSMSLTPSIGTRWTWA